MKSDLKFNHVDILDGTPRLIVILPGGSIRAAELTKEDLLTMLSDIARTLKIIETGRGS